MSKMGVSRAFLVVTVVTCAVAMTAWAQSADRDAIHRLLGTLEGPNAIDAPRQSTTDEGFLKYIGAPAGDAFDVGTTAKSIPSADGAAKSFVLDHAGAFGVASPKLDFSTSRVSTGLGRTYVHLQQTYDGLPVFGSGVTVQLNADGNVECVMSDIMRYSDSLYSGDLAVIPDISPGEAKVAAIAALQADYPGLTFSASDPELVIYEPDVVGAVGTTKLVWDVTVTSQDGGTDTLVAERVLVDAHGGGVVLRYSLIQDALNRQIFDANNVVGDYSGVLVKQEGGPNTGDADVESVYQYFGDTYDFYLTHHGRDSLDNAGLTLRGVVHACVDSSSGCPMQNAFWYGGLNKMFFGAGIVSDDVVGHELTHGVTDNESNLIYYGESGALNESFSDIWGEFVDLTNGKGLDTPDVRWWIGEDLTGPLHNLRYMKDPTVKSDPDKYHGDLWYFGIYDNAGVHINSGVCNKLCYLLTDGDTFNGFTVDGMTLPVVADLYYECQTNLLNPGSDYPDLANALLQAGANLGMSSADIDNISYALYATEIITERGPFLRDFRATGMSQSGQVAITWQNPEGPTPFTGVDLVRRVDRFPDPAVPLDGTVVQSFTGGEESYVDGSFTAGTELFYALYPRAGTFPVNEVQLARVIVGQDVDFLSESFTNGTDLSGHQITFVPVANLEDAANSGAPDSYVNHTNYTATVSDGSGAKVAPNFDGTLPVKKEDIFTIPLSDDGTIALYPAVPFPFFGDFYNRLYLSANGFLSPAAPNVYTDPMDAVPSLENHFSKRRISFLFSDLDPGSGGVVWGRSLADRLVITFEDVPSFADVAVPGTLTKNTVQIELFYNGEIRCTYLDLSAQRAVVGLSDGRGVPLDPADIIGNNLPANVVETDFTSLTSPVDLELLPIAIQYGTIGSTLAFTASAVSNIGPVTYSLTGAPFGAQIDPSTGEFTWDTTGFGPYVYSFVVCATASGVDACQLVNVYLSDSHEKPIASNVVVTPAEPRTSQSLSLTYDYSHPSAPEGSSVILWFKNNTMIPAFNNMTTVYPAATSVGDSWYAVVLPTTTRIGYDYYGTAIYLRGDPVQSNIVTILPDMKTDANKDGVVNSADLQVVVGSVLGIQPEEIDGDVNSDGSTDVSDVQVIVNTILKGGNN